MPELGYCTSDKPYPRGELLVRTHCSIPGYYKQPKVSLCLLHGASRWHARALHGRQASSPCDMRPVPVPGLDMMAHADWRRPRARRL